MGTAIDPVSIGLLVGALLFVALLVLAVRKMARGEIHAPEEKPALDAGDEARDRILEEEALASPSAEVAAQPALEEPADEADPGDAAVEPKVPVDEAAEPATTLEQGLEKSRKGFMSKINKLLFGGRALDDEFVDELEEILVTADIGVKTADRLLHDLRGRLSRKEVDDAEAVRKQLRDQVLEIVRMDSAPIAMDRGPTVIMVIGVNGVGKTTTIGKLAARLTREGKTVVLGAGDTFRAAAVEQLDVWAQRSGCEIVKGAENADPASVIFEAVEKAKSVGADVCIADTAGRLHTKVNLMQELKKVQRVMGKAHEGAPHEVLLVLDATTGQNAISQAKQFKEAVEVTGLALTKLDGTAKGGVLVAICDQLEIPVRMIGIGEGIDDLRDFEPEAFVDALFVPDGDAKSAAS